MRDKRVAILLVSVLLVAGFSMLWAQDAGGDGVEAGWTDVSSDLTVSAGTVYSIENESYIMNASIHVYGTLYINYTYIEFGGEEDGEYGVYVYNTGSLYMKFSNLSAYDKTTYISRPGSGNPSAWTHTWGYHWKFEVSGDLHISHCDLSYIWGADDTNYLTDVYGGLQLRSTSDKTVIVEDTKIYNCEQAGIYIGPYPVTVSHSATPRIHRVTVSNTTATGLIAVGNNIVPDIQNCTFIGNGYKGGNFYYGAAGLMKNCTFANNKYFGFSFDPIQSSVGMRYMSIYDSKFINNIGTGYVARRGGQVTLIDCEFSGNGEYGVDMKWENRITADDENPQLIVKRGVAMDNVLDGFGSTFDDCTATIEDVEVYDNGRHGIRTNSSKMSVTLKGAKVHHNAGWGVYLDGSKGELYDSFIYENGLGSVFLDNQTTSTTRGCKINDTEIGIQSRRSSAGITGNTITGTNKAISLIDSTPDLIEGNVIVDNFIGIESSTDGTNLKANTISGSGSAGIRLFEAKDCMIEGGNFENNNIGISLDDGSSVHIERVTITGSTNTGSIIEGGSSFVIENSTFTGNNRDLTLGDASSGIAVNTTIPISKLFINDQQSTFENYQLLDIYAMDNMTGDFISMPTLVVYDRDLNEIVNAQMSVDGWARKVRMLEYSFEGPNSDDNNPVNITVVKDGYIPYWGGPETVTSYLFRQIEMPVNLAPVWLTPLMVSPAVTHNRRPTITWNASWDWNNDVIKHRLNVYQDEISPSNIILEDAIVRQLYVNDDPQQGSVPPTYTFERNLRFNHQFYVTVETFDPWGMSSSDVFTFMTVNNKPTAPEISIGPIPASTMDDITVEIVSPSTDIDVDPIDEISYFVSFEIERLGSWELIQSGTDMVLPYSMTMENTRIRATVKPFDGYEFGPEVMVYTNVINFLPEAIVDYVHVELTEDEPGVDLVDLYSLFFDADGDKLSFNVKRQNYLTMEIDPLSGANVIIPDEDFFGTDYILIEAIDNKVHVSEDWPVVQINVTVLPVNDPPSFLRVNELTVKEGKPVIIEGVQGSLMVIVPSAMDP
ncbi:MAG: right-handed parallel beta-helix repeat-containing protein, partial [Candidatus Thermoplasmatota archaeon]|nr:right-handed parallel beta-helix repeat-containing protein [Candidatus Thermoplasmatota archaeon]